MKYLRCLMAIFLLSSVIACRNSNDFPDSAIDRMYWISVSKEISNGRIIIKNNVRNAIRGTPITLSIEPSVYFQLGTLGYVLNGKNYDLYSSYNEETQTCVFNMPAGDAEIVGSFLRYIRRINVSVDPPDSAVITTIPPYQASPYDEVAVDISVSPGYRLLVDDEKGFQSFYAISDQGQVNWFETPQDSLYMPDSNITINARLERVYSVEVLGLKDQNDEDIAAVVFRDEKGVRRTEFAGGEKVNVAMNILNTYWTRDSLTANQKNLGINGDGEVSGGFIMPYSDVTLTASFVPNPNNRYSIVVEGGIDNGSITPVTSDGSYRSWAYPNETIYLNIQPTPGYKVTGLGAAFIDPNTKETGSVDIVQASGTVPHFVMPFRPVTIGGSFVIRDLELNSLSSPATGGTITFPGRTSPPTAKMKETVKINVNENPNGNYRLVNSGVTYSYTDEKGVYSSIPLASPYTIQEMPPYDIRVNAQFERVYKVTKNLDTSLVGSATLKIARAGGIEADRFALGEPVYVYVELNDNNYIIDELSFTNGGITSPITDNRFTMPMNDAVVNVSFKLNSDNVYRVSTDASISNGSVIPQSQNGSYLTEAGVGERVYLSISPAAGYELDASSLKAKVNGATEIIINTSGSRPYFTIPLMGSLTDTITVYASFKIKNYTVKGSADPSAGGTVGLSKNGEPVVMTETTANIGDIIAVSVTPNSGYRLKTNGVSYRSYVNGSWSQPVTLQAPYSLKVSEYNVEVTAQFDQLFAVLSTVTPTDAGTVTIRNSSNTIITAGTKEFAVGNTVNVTAVPETGYQLTSLSANRGVGTITGNSFIMPSGGDVTVTAQFSPIQYNITPASVANGSFSVAGKAAYKDTVKVTPQPSSGYEIARLYYNAGAGDVDIDLGTLEFSMPAANITLSGAFARKNLNLSAKVTPTGGGTVVLSPTGIAQVGDPITVTVTPTTTNGNVHRLKSNGVYYTNEAGLQKVQLSGTSPYSFNMPAYNTLVNAEFERLYTVTPDVAGNATVKFTDTNGNDSTLFAYKDKVNIIVTLPSGKMVDTITVNNGPALSEDFFSMPDGNATVSVTLKNDPTVKYLITVNTLTNGTITTESSNGSSLTRAAIGEEVFLNIYPAPGYELDKTTLRYTINNTGASTTINTSGYPASRPSLAVPSMSKDSDTINISAAFVLKSLNLSSTVDPANSGTIAFTNKGNGPTATATLGDTINVAITAGTSPAYRLENASYSYTNESGLQTVPLSGSSPYTFTMKAYDTKVNAEFVRLYTVTGVAGQSGTGTVTIKNAANAVAGQFAAGDTVNVTTSPATGYQLSTLSANQGVGTITGNSFIMPSGISPNGSVNVTATFTKIVYNIITESGDGGTISAPASATYGETINLNPQPSDGYELKTLYYNAGAGNVSVLSTKSFPMPNANVTVGGTFGLKTLTITSVLPSGGPAMTLSKTSATIGEEIKVTLGTNSNYRLRTDGVRYRSSINGVWSSYTTLQPPDYRFNMPGYDVEVSAQYDLLYTVTGTASPSGTGTVTLRNSANTVTTRFIAGETVTINAEPNEGYRLNSLSAGGVSLNGSTFTMPSGNVTVTAAFALQTYYISIQLPVNGSISASPSSASLGGMVTVTVQPSAGYELESLVYDDGNKATSIYKSSPPYSFGMPANNVTVRGTFKPRDLTLSSEVLPAGGGTVNLTPSTGIAQVGNAVSAEVTPAASPNKYRLRTNGVSYNYTDAGGARRIVLGAPYSFNMPGYNTVVRGEFDRLYTVSKTTAPLAAGTVEIRNAGGAVTGEFAQGETVTVLAAPAEGYQLVNVSVNNDIGVIDGDTFIMPGANVTVTATFEKQKYTAYAVSDGNGHLYLYQPGSELSSSIITAEMGDKITLDILPAVGYEFDAENLYCRTSAMENVPIVFKNDQYYFVMPASDVTVACIFDKKGYNLTTEIRREPGDTESTIALSTNTPQTGEEVTIIVSPLIGHEIKSLAYYLPGSSIGVEIDKKGQNYAFIINSGVENGATVHIVASFGKISHRLNIEPAALDGGTFSFYDTSGNIITTAGYAETIKVYLKEKSEKGYMYKDQSFKVYTINSAPVPLLSAAKDTVVNGRYIFTFSMPNSSVILSAEYDRYLYNLSPAGDATGSVKNLSKTSLVPIGSYITFIAEPAEGYRILNTGFSVKNGSSTVKSSSGFAPTGNPNEYGFYLDFTVTQAPADRSDLTVNAQFALESYGLSKDPNSTGTLISFSHSGNVLFGSTVTVTIARTYSSRYVPGTVKLNGGNDDSFFLTPEVANPDGTYTRTFKMPARAVTVSADSEPIPLALVDINDPNMDKYIHVLNAINSVEIDEVKPGGEITVEAYKPAYPGAPPNDIEVIPLEVESWWLDTATQSGLGPNPRIFTIPDPCFARVVTVVVLIGGKPHSVSIPIKYE